MVFRVAGAICMAVTLVVLQAAAVAALKPRRSWADVGSMSFFHSCNETGLYSEEALQTIIKFPMVTIEKGQGFNNNTDPNSFAEDKIVAQLKAVKEANASVSTVMYMNSIRDWQFYRLHQTMEANATLRVKDKYGKDIHISGDPRFNPPKGGMWAFNHANPGMRDLWIKTCMDAVNTGYVDGCFSDSSQEHDSTWKSNRMSQGQIDALDAGIVDTMSSVTAALAKKTGGPLIGKIPTQQGITAYQIEMFNSNNDSIVELIAGAQKGWLVQAHVEPPVVVCKAGPPCDCLTDVLSAFLIGAGDNSYFGYGAWISAGLTDVQQRWCPDLFTRPVGAPKADATYEASTHMWSRSFASGTSVTFDAVKKQGAIVWSA